MSIREIAAKLNLSLGTAARMVKNSPSQTSLEGGLQSAYEPPEKPELVVDGDREMPETAARRVIIKLAEKAYLRDD